MKFLKDWLEKRKFRKWLKENKWNGLIPGDIVEFNGKKIMYRGINGHGGPGQPGCPEPYFREAHPGEPRCIYYIRDTSAYVKGIGPELPNEIFGEDAAPIQAGDSNTGMRFISSPRKLEKVGHITPEEWDLLAAAL